ncbi:conserved hypothetical protein [Candidatus Terasakiella magnetica]|nr:conserved hypothetical protein [Candidatus Terasakiella magnetica]
MAVFYKTTSLLKLNRAIGSLRLKFLYVLLADMLGWRHTIVRLDPVLGCNLRCRMCCYSDAQWVASQPRARFSTADFERLAEQFFPTALQVHVGCGAEPTTDPRFPDIIRLAKAYGVPHVALVTNAMALRQEQFRRAVDLGLDEVVVSSHGTTRESFERMMTGASFDRHLSALRMIADESAAGGPALRINFTVCAETIEDLAALPGLYARYGMRTLQIRPITPLDFAQYRTALPPALVPRYRALVAAVRAECAALGVTVLANVTDPAHAEVNYSASVYQVGVLRVISPLMVWKPGFDFRIQDVAAFKRSIGFRRELLGRVLRPKADTGPSALAASSVLD